MLEERIKKLIEARRNRRETWARVLGELHEQLEDAFEEIRILGCCGHCTACYNQPCHEEGIILGKLAFTDGGNCYAPAVCIHTEFGWKRLAVKPYNVLKKTRQWTIADKATKADFEVAKKALETIKEKIEQLTEQEKNLATL